MDELSLITTYVDELLGDTKVKRPVGACSSIPDSLFFTESSFSSIRYRHYHTVQCPSLRDPETTEACGLAGYQGRLRRGIPGPGSTLDST